MSKLSHRQQYTLFLAFIACVMSALITARRTDGMSEILLLRRVGLSFASVITEITFVVGLMATAISFRRYASPVDQPQNLLGFGISGILRIGVALAVALLGMFVAILVFSWWWLNTDGLRLSPLAMTAFAGIYAGLLTYGVVRISIRMSTLVELRTAGLLMLLGVGMAIAVSQNYDWWTKAISFLGVNEYGIIFNATFILGGLVLLSVMQDKMSDLDVLHREGFFRAPYLRPLVVLITVLCLCVAGIGLFPYAGRTTIFHQLAAHLAIVLFLIMAVAIGRIVPIYPPMFMRLSFGLAVLGVIVVGLYYAGYAGFSLMEINLLITAAAWIILFYTFTRAYIMEKKPALITGGDVSVPVP